MGDETFKDEITITIEAGQTLVLDITAKKKESDGSTQDNDSGTACLASIYLFDQDDKVEKSIKKVYLKNANTEYPFDVVEGLACIKNIPAGIYEVLLSSHTDNNVNPITDTGDINLLLYDENDTLDKTISKVYINGGSNFIVDIIDGIGAKTGISVDIYEASLTSP